jgi:negative regulator of flagellin synthesis FlgM
MEIDGRNPLIDVNNNVQRIESSQQAVRNQRRSGDASGSDQLDLSIRGQEMSRIEELAQSIPDVRESKIERIRGAIESGTYNVKAEKIAEKILAGNLLDELF